MQIEFSMPEPVLSVSEITSTLVKVIQGAPELKEVSVQGQISDLGQPKSGIIYFRLKDAKSQIRCVMFRQNVIRLQFVPDNGDEVLVKGTVAIYAANGEYQIRVRTMEPRGIGALQIAFEALKQKLAAEGLFDTSYKKPLPGFPRKIGVITSDTGAVIQDMRQQLQKRYPLAELLLYPTSVQGADAARQIAHAIGEMNKRTDLDVLIVGRGGGSIEDLWSFNEEAVARAIFASKIPVISAVGHETDFTISDMVADHRAPTPSTAIENLVPDRVELLAQLESLETRLQRNITFRLQTQHTNVAALEAQLSLTRRKDAIYQLYQLVDGLENACQKAMNHRIETAKNELQAVAGKLDGLSPLNTLKRGYSISKNSAGDIITSSQQVEVGEQLSIDLSDGRLACTVNERFES